MVVCWVPGTLSLGCNFATLSAAHREMHSRLQPQEQVTSHAGFPTLVNGSWASAAGTGTSHKPTSRPLARTGPLGILSYRSNSARSSSLVPAGPVMRSVRWSDPATFAHPSDHFLDLL